MPDVSAKVDGVEPSILVKLLNIAENPHSVMVNVDKWIHKEFEEPIKVTSDELSKLGSFAVEVIRDIKKDVSNQETLEESASDSGVVKLTSANPSSGQTSPQIA